MVFRSLTDLFRPKRNGVLRFHVFKELNCEFLSKDAKRGIGLVVETLLRGIGRTCRVVRTQALGTWTRMLAPAPVASTDESAPGTSTAEPAPAPGARPGVLALAPGARPWPLLLVSGTTMRSSLPAFRRVTSFSWFYSSLDSFQGLSSVDCVFDRF